VATIELGMLEVTRGHGSEITIKAIDSSV